MNENRPKELTQAQKEAKIDALEKIKHVVEGNPLFAHLEDKLFVRVSTVFKSLKLYSFPEVASPTMKPGFFFVFDKAGHFKAIICWDQQGVEEIEVKDPSDPNLKCE